MIDAEAEAAHRWPMPYPQPQNAAQRRDNLVRSALRLGFIEGAAWFELRALGEEGRRLASEREDLIAAGVDPSLLEVPLHPDVGRCSECGEALSVDAVGSEAGGHEMCGACLHDAVRSGWEPGA